MKLRTILRTLAACLFLAGGASIFAQDTADKPSPTDDLKALLGRVEVKVRAGNHTKESLADEIKTFDELATKYKDDKSNDAGDIFYMRGVFYVNLLQDMEKGVTLLQAAKKAYPDSKYARLVDQLVADVQSRIDAKKAKEALVSKAAPELNFIWGSRKGLKTLSALKGKVVVLDFWATWCGPCVASFPEIKKIADHYHGYDVEIVGVTSLQGRVAGLEAKPIDCEGDPAKEEKLLGDFMKAKDMNWTVGVSKEEVFNKDYSVNSIPHMTIIAPDGTVRQNGLHPSMTPYDEKVKMIDALLKEAKLKTPPAS